MFMPRYPKALAAFHRVLKPGGVLALAVWQSLARWPFLRVVLGFCAGERGSEECGVGTPRNPAALGCTLHRRAAPCA